MIILFSGRNNCSMLYKGKNVTQTHINRNEQEEEVNKAKKNNETVPSRKTQLIYNEIISKKISSQMLFLMKVILSMTYFRLLTTKLVV